MSSIGPRSPPATEIVIVEHSSPATQLFPLCNTAPWRGHTTMATQNTNTNSNVTVSFLPTKGTFKKGDKKGQPVGMWLAISKPYSLTVAAKEAITANFKYSIQRWEGGAEHTYEPSMDFSGASKAKGATDNLYYLGPIAVFGRPDVQQGIMGILSQDGALKVSAPQPAKTAPQSAGAVYQLLGTPQPQAVAPQVAPQVQQAAAYQPQFLNYNLPQAPQVAPQPQPVAAQAEAPKKFIRIG